MDADHFSDMTDACYCIPDLSLNPANTHAHTHAHKHTHSHTDTHTPTQTHTLTHTLALIKTQTHTHTHNVTSGQRPDIYSMAVMQTSSHFKCIRCRCCSKQ